MNGYENMYNSLCSRISNFSATIVFFRSITAVTLVEGSAALCDGEGVRWGQGRVCVGGVGGWGGTVYWMNDNFVFGKI